MFNQCKVYKGTVVINMYPTWEKNNPKKLHMIAKKYRKVYQSSIVCKPSAPVKRKTTDDIELAPPKYRNLVVKATPKPPKSPSRSKPRQRTKAVIQRMKFEEPQQADDSERYSDSEDPTYASFEDNIEVQSPKEASDIHAPAVEPQISKELGCTSLGTTFDKEVFHVVKHQRASKYVI
jgi:hypothetical protein